MAKSQNDLMLDAAFDWVRARVTGISVCSTQPTTYDHAYTTYCLAKTAMTSTGLTIADATGASGGRKVTIQAKSAVSVIASGTAAHIALFGSTGATALLLVTTCTTQALTSGNTVNIPAWKDAIADAT